ncbi:pectinesterase-like [Olea europaea var. sylvestris]|uniref:pectinesterase-like n=1 Tax=Olea europaea var. sylvestris TaxID=158386 RepID=UPI000C1D3542|nr:pectinesterase-like [Olea europaea var. sylvestris]
MENIFGQKSKLILIFLSCFSLVLFTLCTLNSHVITQRTSPISSTSIHIHKHIQVANTHCQGTLYPELCVSTLSTFPDLHKKSIPEVISDLVNVTTLEVRACAANATGLRRRLKKLDPIDRRALDDCLELFSDTVAELKIILSELGKNTSAEKNYLDFQTLLSAAMTNQYTCLDGFAYSKNNTRRFIQGRLKKISKHVSNSLAMLKKIKKKKEKGSRNNEVFDEYGSMKNSFPVWLKKKDRALLQAPANQTKFNLVVAKDGSGNFTTINEALSAAPNNSNTRFVIYIKGGAYYEYIEVERKKSMIMFVGDGIGKTLIKGNRSVVDGWTTFRSSTVAVVGNGFIAKGITFENYAGPSKHQAVALRSGADFSAFYQCSFVGYQDTLYVHSLRQFYRECDIYGTVDFIFGNAAVVFQNSNLYARKPNDNQRNIYTAQGREDPNQNTGISILNCKVAAAADLIPVQSSFRTYLGRPWKQYSRTVFLLSNIGDLVEPAGWMEWNGTFALDTLYYGEYRNRGPGSNTTARVSWPGYRVINSSTEASQFTVANFIQGNQWLPATGIPFYSNLTAV